MKLSRRHVLKGLGGLALSLPVLESLPLGRARAQDVTVPPFAVFFRQACGVACAQNTGEIGMETEKFWPTQKGALSDATLQSRALDELLAYRDKLLVVGNVNYGNFNFGDGHARGAMQGLTARPPLVENAGGDSEAGGESLDHRIGAELNPDGRDSLFLYAGTNGWLGGACISHRGAGDRRAPFNNPKSAYEAVAGLGSSASASGDIELLAQRQRSVNDLVRAQMQRLLGMSQLSQNDRERLQLHFDSVRDLETKIACVIDESVQRQLDGADAIYQSTDGDDVLTIARLHMDVSVLAIACGYTRSAAIQVGSGNDGSTRYRDTNGNLMENYHYISHRRLSHDSTGAVIPNADMLHHQVDRHFGRTFKYLLDKLSSYSMPDGKTLLEHGVAVWYNDNANGPAHATNNVPWVLAGSANGFLKQGQYIDMPGSGPNLGRLHNTIGSAVGLRNAAGDYLDNFGDPSTSGGVVNELMA